MLAAMHQACNGRDAIQKLLEHTQPLGWKVSWVNEQDLLLSCNVKHNFHQIPLKLPYQHR